jgi:hypothetical protein
VGFQAHVNVGRRVSALALVVPQLLLLLNAKSL